VVFRNTTKLRIITPTRNTANKTSLRFFIANLLEKFYRVN
jgi:hypothetical protein